MPSSPFDKQRAPAMMLDNVLASLFPLGHAVERGPWGTLHGTANVESLGNVTVVGIAGGTPLGVDGAILLAGHVLAAMEADDCVPIVVLVDTSTQSMTRRDELLGLNEYLAHLAKTLALAADRGHPTVSILFGTAAAGAFIATVLSSRLVVALRPGAQPSVMDLPTMSRITRLPLEKLQELAKSTPIFAPGVEPLFAIGAISESWEDTQPLAPRLAALLRQPNEDCDVRDRVGFERGGRLLAQNIAARIVAEASAHD